MLIHCSRTRPPCTENKTKTLENVKSHLVKALPTVFGNQLTGLMRRGVFTFYNDGE